MQIPDASHFCPSFLVQESKWAQTSFGQHLESSVDFCRRVVTLVCSAKKTQQSVRSVAYHGAPFDSIADPRGCLQLVGSVMGGAFLFFFSMGFFYLRAENFRKGKKFQKDGTSRVKGLEPQFRAPVPLLKLANLFVHALTFPKRM